MRLVLTLLAAGVLAACNHVLPNDGAVEEKLPISEPVSEEITAEVVLDENGDPIEQEEVRIVVIDNDNPEISNTQDFSATSENLSIEDDRALLKAQAKKFKVIEPTALPQRSGRTESIVAFALQSKNAVGEKIYSRINPLGANLAKKNCLKYRSADDAQLAFLKAGGPKRDARNLDPDGDGFACAWSPEPYRKIVN